MISSRQIKPLNIAHRGARAFAPENTLAAFALANRFGCDMIELDVRLSKDGAVIVYHDDHLKRCTDAVKKFPDRADYLVSGFTVQELKMLDAGSWFLEQLSMPEEKREGYLKCLSEKELDSFIGPEQRKHFANGDITIPTLAEALSLANELALSVNVELKSCGDNNSRLVYGSLEDIEKSNIGDRVLISSFDLDLIEMTRSLSEHIRTAALVDLPLRNPLTTLRRLKASAYNMNCYHGYQSEGYRSKAGRRYLKHIEKIRTAGFDVNVWTCNNVEEMKGLFAAGASGVISDFPNRFNEAWAEFAQAG